MSLARTYRGGHVAMGSELSITNGVNAQVRALILEREAKDRERRKAYRKAPTVRPGSKQDTFKPFVPPAHLA